MVITVFEIPPSNNKYLGNSHNFNAYRREKERWHWLIKAAAAAASKSIDLANARPCEASLQGKPPTGGAGEQQEATARDKPKEPFSRAKVKITYFFPDARRRDPDNYSGKFILDPLVKEGIIQDDSFKCVTLELHADVDRKRPRTEIEVEKISV